MEVWGGCIINWCVDTHLKIYSEKLLGIHIL